LLVAWRKKNWTAVCLIAMGALPPIYSNNETPEKALRALPTPSVMVSVIAGGGGMVAVEESREHALARGAKIYAEITPVPLATAGDMSRCVVKALCAACNKRSIVDADRLPQHPRHLNTRWRCEMRKRSIWRQGLCHQLNQESVWASQALLAYKRRFTAC
jgi:hypothetical protein